MEKILIAVQNGKEVWVEPGSEEEQAWEEQAERDWEDLFDEEE